MRLVTLLTGIALAVVVGYWLGIGQNTYLGYLMGLAVLVVVTLGMQRKAWILIPLTWLWAGSISKLPLPFAVRDLGVLLAVASYVAYRVLSQENLRPKLHLLDLLVGLNVMYLAFTVVKNPVGFNAFGASTVGGRPLVNICIAIMAYWVIIRLPGSVTEVSRIPYYLFISAAFMSGLNLLIYIVPSLTPTVMSWYSGLDIGLYLGGLHGTQGVQRLKGMMSFGFQLFLLLCVYYPPGTLFDPRRGRFYAMLLATVSILVSGFRGILLWMVAGFGISGWLRRRWRELVVAGFVGAALVAVLAFGQGRFYDLPTTVQRSLTFLPGRWSEAAITDAESSSTWRFDLWRKVVEWNLIKNWWFGDGFGANVEDLIATLSGGQRQYTDFIILTGAFHSGPLTAIRYVGTCGLLLLYLLSISAAIYSYKCAVKCRGTLLFPIAIYLAIQLIWGPIEYAFIFGGYDAYLPDLLFHVACLRLLIRMSGEWKQKAVAKAKLAPVQVQPTAGAIA